ncbi:hypothetical protein [Amycolatopsis taiwanensis]|uniref:Uncharacterized protein n=1 Tax=Amycolatopsis taiwanensis TaxID=342230 RepID=A0A9W6QX98_9PSEU|nr:hypothetical protein [Amycolatopsis taiwanensis]GLY63737.1 hypothetical protein Atai01_03560 [Amycolatopsis taiwanensis]
MTESDGSDGERRAKGLPKAPGLPEATATGVTPPMPVRVSFWLWVASAVVLVVCYVVPVVYRQQIIDQNIKATPQYSPEQVASGTTTFLVLLLVGAVSFAAMYVLFAYKARQGTRSARTVLTVFFAVALVFQYLFGLFQLVLALLAMLIALIALFLMYLPAVRPYFPKPDAATGGGRPGLGSGSFLPGGRKRS